MACVFCFQNAQVVDFGSSSAQCPHGPDGQELEPSEGPFSFSKLKWAAPLRFPADFTRVLWGLN